jgi:hypothetical protein
MYILDEETGEWEYISQHKISIPVGLSDLEYYKLGHAGDMAYMYPEEPEFTKPARWFRYEAIAGFLENYTKTNNISGLSEITLYGRKTQ